MDLSFLDPNSGDNDLIRQAFGELRPGDLILDVGAKTGFLTLLAAQRVGDGGLVIVV